MAPPSAGEPTTPPASQPPDRPTDAISPAGADAPRRIDQWLWFARLAKSRTLAQKLIAAGTLRINRDKVTAADRRVAPGDVLTLAVHGRVRVLEVCATGTRRGPAAEAAALYRDLAPTAPASSGIDPPPATDPAAGPRPARDDRRSRLALKRGPGD